MRLSLSRRRRFSRFRCSPVATRSSRWIASLLHIGVLLLLLPSVLAGESPVQAEGQADLPEHLLPYVQTVQTMNEHSILTFNRRPLQICQTRWETWNRLHRTCQELVTVPELNLNAGLTREHVYYDGTIYTRVNSETTWVASPDEEYNPAMTMNEGNFTIAFEAKLVSHQDVLLNNVPVTQYQYWAVNEEFNKANGGQVVYDMFVSRDNYVVQTHLNRRGSFVGLRQRRPDVIGGKDPLPSNDELAVIRSFSDFNTTIVVTPPISTTVRT